MARPPIGACGTRDHPGCAVGARMGHVAPGCLARQGTTQRRREGLLQAYLTQLSGKTQASFRSIRCYFEPLVACREVLNERLVVKLCRLDMANREQIRHEVGRERVAWVTGGHVDRVNHVERWLRRHACIHVTRLLENHCNSIQ